MMQLYRVTNDYLVAHEGLTNGIYVFMGWVFGHEMHNGSWSDRKRQAFAKRVWGDRA